MRSPRIGRGRTIGAILLAIVSTLTAVTPAHAHVVTASIFARDPVCHPRCADAGSIKFRTSVRLDACVPAPGSPLCFVDIRAIVWAQVERDGVWTTVRGPTSIVARLEAGKRINIAISVDCSADQGVRYRTGSQARVIGAHSFYTNTPNPVFTSAVPVSC